MLVDKPFSHTRQVAGEKSTGTPPRKQGRPPRRAAVLRRVVLAEGFGQQQIAVDTHVFRLANRIGLTAEKDVLKTELGLQKAIPKDRWTLAHHALIFHGRRCCHARGPECGRCPINDICEKNGVGDVQTL